jgi:acyl carrier protein
MTKDEATALLAEALRDIAPEVDLGAVDRDLLLQQAADIDSVSFMALVTAIHDRAGIQIPFRDYPKLATVNSFVAYLMSARRPADSADRSGGP